MEDIVFFNGVPSMVLCFGGVLPMHLRRDPPPEKLILIVPGYPGSARFYERLAEEIHKRTGKPVWVPAYAGCTYGLHIPDPETNKHLYDCEAQVNYIKSLIHRYLSGVELIVVAHSFGAWITLLVLDDESCNMHMKKAYLMTPGFERINYSEFSLKVWNTCQNGTKFPRLTKWAAPIFDWINCKINNVSKLYPVTKVLDSNNILPIFYLYLDVFRLMKDRKAVKLVAQNVNKVKLYYSSRDHWIPTSFCEDLKKDIPNVDAQVDCKNLCHDFEFDQWIEGGEIITEWVNEIWTESQSP